jgi:chemotaxis protein MotB
MRTRLIVALPMLLAAATMSCGPSHEEYRAALDKNAALQQNLDAEKRRVAELEKQLQDLGVEVKAKSTEVNRLSGALDDQAKALAQYKARAAQLEAIRARFEVLRKKLDALTKIGLQVHVRRNRMVISLPGDVLFDTGKDTLKKDGEDILGKVAAVIKNDRSLINRDYQVTGHTDNQPLQGGVFRDNWGLSLMRARSVLVFLVGGKGILPAKHWSAAGFADTDPVATNGTKDGQQKNRRCELIVVPDADEMLDLRSLVEK